MADITPTVNRRIDPDNGTSVKVTWNSLSVANNVGTPAQFVSHADRCVEVRGTFNNTTVVLEGSNGGTVYFTLKDPAGSAISFTANGLRQVVERPLFMRPNILNSNNDANVAVTMDLLALRSNPYTR
jgi:hypothetical protein